MNPGLAQTFDQDAQGYDQFRPGYPEPLFQAIFDYGKFEPHAHCLEIGAGTGQATRVILSNGLCVDALEPGGLLAAELVKNLGGHPQLTVIQSRFEDFHGRSQSLDMIYSASAFHWVPKSLAYRKAIDLLKPGGTLALFWHSFSVNRQDDPTHQALQGVFELHNFSMTEQSYDPLRYQRKQKSLTKRGFVEVCVQLFRSSYWYTVNQFVGLLSTTSRFRMFSPEEQDSLVCDIKKLLAKDEGVWVDQTCDLYLGKRPDVLLGA